MVCFLNTIVAQKRVHNSLLFTDLVVSDVIAIDTSYFTGFSYAKEFYRQNIEKIAISEKLNLKSLLVKKMMDLSFPVYLDYSPYADVYFEKYEQIFVKADRNKLLEDLGGKADTIVRNNDANDLERLVVNESPDTSEIKGILFFDNWIFNEKEFKFYKNVLAYCPIRRYSRPSDDFNRWDYRKTAWFVFPKLKKAKQKRLEKRMQFLGHFEYEYAIENKLMFGKDNENGLYLEEVDAPNWNSYARQNLRNIIIKKALSGASKVVDYKTKMPMEQGLIMANLGYEVRDITYIDPETEETKIESVETEIYKEDIKSIIFIEDWYIDIETMRIKKEVKAMAPVRFYTYDGVIPKKKIAFMIYLN